ncbi:MULTISPECIES: NAD(P)H-hydrate dehydratase [Enterococcus]|uniref:NAD(P)H-hydrate dehydratase n=1 Tax=Enterococcus TaxID=1350 RepID=UPI00094C8BD5|nr:MULTISPECIES: NAD(P)H-hydrate dehydratase [Enterococcus]OTP22575.1 YjeF family domain-containing protein [Enterococcus sp. 5B7_DIV0075]GMC01187.1 ADP-dependent (S)-NAD(P)H-hydrate dehydratase [Enterococcus thailandicus]
MILDEQLLREVITKRPKHSHKGTFGRVVLIGGNQQYGGAIIMSALAAVNSGAGLTTVITDKKNHAPLHVQLPEAMVVDWYDQATCLTVIQQADVLLIGPGLGTSTFSLGLLQMVLKVQTNQQWLVIDGSALTLLAKAKLSLPYPEHTVLTPHQMEWQRLSGIAIATQTDQLNQEKQHELGAILVVKSHQTTIYNKENIYYNQSGSAAMATGGTGDTLAGMITAFLAQFPQNDHTVAAAVYLHSFIGDHLAQTHYVVLPTLISQAIPQWMAHFCTE